MSSFGEYYGVEPYGDKWAAMYDYEQKLVGKVFDTKEEAEAYVEEDGNNLNAFNNLIGREQWKPHLDNLTIIKE